MANGLFDREDEGKRVIDWQGNELGIVSRVRGRTAYISPDPGIGNRILSRLGWENVGDDEYPLDGNSVDTITDDEIRLKRHL